jgi:hypothetical protein
VYSTFTAAMMVVIVAAKPPTISLTDSSHNHAFAVLHQKNLPEASFLCLMARGRQLLLL